MMNNLPPEKEDIIRVGVRHPIFHLDSGWSLYTFFFLGKKESKDERHLYIFNPI